MTDHRLDDLSEAIFAIADKLSDRIVEQRKHKARRMILEDLIENLRLAWKYQDASWLVSGKPCLVTLEAVHAWLQNKITEEGAWLE